MEGEKSKTMRGEDRRKSATVGERRERGERERETEKCIVMSRVRKDKQSVAERASAHCIRVRDPDDAFSMRVYGLHRAKAILSGDASCDLSLWLEHQIRLLSGWNFGA